MQGLEAVWTGPILIRDRSESLSREDARRQLGLPVEGTIVYVTFGGGGDELAESGDSVEQECAAIDQDVDSLEGSAE